MVKAGRGCVALRASTRRVLYAREAGWYLGKGDDCGSERPFVCQAFGVTAPLSLTASEELLILGGHVIGSGTLLSPTSAQVRAAPGFSLA